MAVSNQESAAPSPRKSTGSQVNGAFCRWVWQDGAMIVVSGVITVDPANHDQMVSAGRAVAEASRAEPGCHEYGFWADPDHLGRFRVFEEWESQQALEEHFATSHFADFGAALGDLGVTGMEVNRYVDPEKRDLF
jgi:quinol monooxygenase YgiN